jgi:hypothetical protein
VNSPTWGALSNHELPALEDIPTKISILLLLVVMSTPARNPVQASKVSLQAWHMNLEDLVSI